MKLLTFVIPSYNSEQYLASCLDSLNIGVDEKIEAIVVNDGSTDKTSDIAHNYAKKFNFIKVIDKENGGHGSGINVGISQAALIAIADITIGNNVKIGGGVKIYTTDFHSLDPMIRKSKGDVKNRIKKPVVIKENAFIGAHAIILKGVTVGENSIVGAGSVVTKDIPDNQIWAGNPARFIRNI